MTLLPSSWRLPLGALALLLAASGAAHATDIAQGKKLATKYCSRCHAVGATGTSPRPSAPPFRIVAAKGHVEDLQEALAEGIMVGHPDMPEFALAPDQIGALIAYLGSLAPKGR
jgi:cytochrome c